MIGHSLAILVQFNPFTDVFVRTSKVRVAQTGTFNDLDAGSENGTRSRLVALENKAVAIEQHRAQSYGLIDSKGV